MRPPVEWESQRLRCLLFAPGSEPRKLRRVHEFGADGVVLDLEDAVAEAEKTEARATVRGALAGLRATPVVVVRVNGADTNRFADDVRAVVTPDLDCVMVPKVEDPALLDELDALLAELEAPLGLERGTIRVLPILETAAGVANADAIAAGGSGRLVTLLFGIADYSRDLGIEVGAEGHELLYARSRVAIAARAAGLRAPLDGPWLDLQDLDGLAAETRRVRALGFGGRIAIYPAQVDVIQRTCSELSDTAREQLRRVVEEFERAEAEGIASIQVDGRFVDYPVYVHAKQRLA
jgi:citrate lyase subunit beta/citryl-CoA lyase